MSDKEYSFKVFHNGGDYFKGSAIGGVGSFARSQEAAAIDLFKMLFEDQFNSKKYYTLIGDNGFKLTMHRSEIKRKY